MSKFKLGDRIRTYDDNHGSGYPDRILRTQADVDAQNANPGKWFVVESSEKTSEREQLRLALSLIYTGLAEGSRKIRDERLAAWDALEAENKKLRAENERLKKQIENDYWPTSMKLYALVKEGNFERRSRFPGYGAKRGNAGQGTAKVYMTYDVAARQAGKDGQVMTFVPEIQPEIGLKDGPDGWRFKHCGESVYTDYGVLWHCCGQCGQMFKRPE